MSPVSRKPIHKYKKNNNKCSRIVRTVLHPTKSCSSSSYNCDDLELEIWKNLQPHTEAARKFIVMVCMQLDCMLKILEMHWRGNCSRFIDEFYCNLWDMYHYIVKRHRVQIKSPPKIITFISKICVCNLLCNDSKKIHVYSNIKLSASKSQKIIHPFLKLLASFGLSVRLSQTFENL